MSDIEKLISKGFYQIKDKSLLIQAYKEVFNLPICATCTGDQIKAYNELNKFFMAKNDQNKEATTKGEYTFKPERVNDEIAIQGLGVFKLGSLTQDQIKAHILPHPAYKSMLAE